MQALVYEGAGQVRLREASAPQAGADEALVRVRAVGICGSDLGIFRGEMAAVQAPLVPGHEFGGWLDNGDFVVVNPMVGCGHCAACTAGRTQVCVQRKVIGVTRAGACTEWIAVPRRNLLAVPALSTLQAALVEPLANGVHGWHRAGRPSGPVAIIGAGAIGMCLLHVLRAKGLDDITVVDPVAERRTAARAAGARHTAAALSGQFEAVFDAAGTAQTRTDALACTMLGGTVALLGLHDDRLPLSAAALIVGDRTLAGCFGYSEPEFAEAAQLAATLDAPWAQAIPVHEAESAIAALLAGTAPPERIKTVIQWAD